MSDIWAEGAKRMEEIGRNGNEGLHYDEVKKDMIENPEAYNESCCSHAKQQYREELVNALAEENKALIKRNEDLERALQLCVGYLDLDDSLERHAFIEASMLFRGKDNV